MRTGENKKTAFKRLATNRVNNVIKNLRLLGNLSSRQNYEYSESETKFIFNTIDDELKLTKSRFKLATTKRKRIKL